MTDGDRSQERAVQRHAIGVSVEALASAWARREDVPDGSVVVVGSEIAARRRLGEPWSADADDSLALGMILRPDIGLDQQDLLWLVGALAAAECAAACSSIDPTIHWPDRLEVAGTGVAVAFVNVVTQLGPGRIEHAVVSLRFFLSQLGLTVSDRSNVFDHAVTELAAAASLLASNRQRLIDAVTEQSSTIGSRAKASLVPRGEARGVATALDLDGRLVLESSTGMLEYLAVDSVRKIELM